MPLSWQGGEVFSWLGSKGDLGDDYDKQNAAEVHCCSTDGAIPFCLNCFLVILAFKTQSSFSMDARLCSTHTKVFSLTGEFQVAGSITLGLQIAPTYSLGVPKMMVCVETNYHFDVFLQLSLLRKLVL